MWLKFLFLRQMRRAKSRKLVVGNIHVLYNAIRGEVKLCQICLLSSRAQVISEKWGNAPVVLAGDFNITPQSAIYQFLSSSELNIKLYDRRELSGQRSCHPAQVFGPKKEMSNPFAVIDRFFQNCWTDKEVKVATGRHDCHLAVHPLKLYSSHASVKGSTKTRGLNDEPLATSYHFKFFGTVDYIWYSNGLVPTRVLDTLPVDTLRRTGGLPSKSLGSDHLALVSEFAFVPGTTKEGDKSTCRSVKTFTYESLNNIVRLINGISAILLAFLPGKATILEGIHGWELRPTFRGPRFPRWMENGVSSFNRFVHELSVDSDTSSVDYSSGEEDFDGIYPSTPSSHSSRFSRASTFTNYERHQTGWIMCILCWILYPAKFLLGLPFRLGHLSSSKVPKASSTSHQTLHLHSNKRAHTLKDHVVHCTTDRRRGVIEDLHLAIEIFIEAVFDVVHKASHLILSPSKSFTIAKRWFSSDSNITEDIHDDVSDAFVHTATLGENDSAVQERKTTFQQSTMNTDARTCQDVITELGYPYEAIHVVTSDGYVLLLERIPRRDARKAVYLQHGILDTSMGWVSNGIVGSPAFAAYDQGYDVFLGNFRGLVSREHVDKNISSRQYWRYSINEHGTEDIPALIEKIHEIKTSELKLSHPDLEEETNGDQPYKLCAICHSLGGAGILMYVVTRQLQEKPHRLSRLILLSPAGFHDDSNLMFTMVEYVFLFLAPILAPIVPGIYIPTRFFRMLLNKLARDFQNYPAVGGLVQTLMSYVVGGDSSNWVGVLGLPHYNMNDMPGVSFRVAHHLAQMKHAGKFRMYDYGSAINMEVYGSPEPLDLGEYYGHIDIPVDLVAGHKDRIIRPAMVRKHYKLMKESGVDVSYNEFEYAHLDFTFSHREELLAYVMSRLLLVEPTSKQQFSQKKKRQVNS
ncbi:hypothetical protein ACOSQ3_026391 [Xanthoceras sorbifolium]